MTNLKKTFQFRYRFLIFFLILLSGCATENFSQMYQGPVRTDSEIAKLLLPSSLEIAEVDGYSKRTPYIPDGFQPIDFLPGKHIIRVFYDEYWGASTGGSVVTSDIFTFELKLKAGENYVFKHNGPEDLINADIENFVNDIDIWLYQPDTDTKIQATGRVVYGNFINRTVRGIGTYSASTENAEPQNSVEQLQHFWKIADDKQRAVFKTWVASRSLGAKPATESITPNEEKSSETQTSTNNDVSQELEHWWKMADDKQRKEFNDWLAKRSLDGKGLY